MKKILGIIVLGLLLSGNAYADCIKGDCVNGLGTWVFNDTGDKYIGAHKNGRGNGQGTYIFSNGNKYVGGHKDDQRHGQGIYTWSDGSKYVGEWKEGKKNGQGTHIWPDGAKYIGEFKDDQRSGQAILTYADGTIENGIFENGKLIEKQQVAKVLKTSDDNDISSTISTEFSSDINKIKPAANIKKEYRIKDDNVISSLFSSTLPPCKGTFGLKTRWTDCHGAVIYPNGDKYVGEWKYDKRHGNGTIFWKTPINDRYNLYVGEWQNDNEEGKGVLYGDSSTWSGGFIKYYRYPGCWNNYHFTKIEMYTLINDVNPCGNLVKTYFCKGMKCSKEEYDITQKRENQKRSTYANVYSEFDNCPKIYDYLVTKMYTYSQNTAQHNLLKTLALKTKKMIKTSGGYDSNSISWCQDWMVMGLESTGGL